MFPWVYGFSWTMGNVIFLGVFFAVITTIGSTLVFSLLRTSKHIQSHHADKIRWESEFHDLPLSAKSCRHQFTGEFTRRICDHCFECHTCATHADLMRGRTQNSDDIQTPVQVNGFTMPMDRLYHRGHTWVKPEASGTYTVGLDDFALRLIGTPDGMSLPSIGTDLHLHERAWGFTRGHTHIRILSPLEGTVVATGDGSEGWFLKIMPLTSEALTTHLLRDREAAAWLLKEFERLQRMLADPTVGVTFADGGIPVQDFTQAYPDRNWDVILCDMFLEA